jgi:hypothetical protein
MDNWQLIETAPSDGRPILVWGGAVISDGGMATVQLADGDWWRMRKKDGSSTPPTHWMPLPEPPDV